MIVKEWTGHEVQSLRKIGLRETQQEFAETTGFSVHAVRKWEKATSARPLRGRAAEAMDTVLTRLTERQRERFHAAVGRQPMEVVGPPNLWGNAADSSATEDADESVAADTIDSRGLAVDAGMSIEFAEWVSENQPGQLTVDALAYELARIAQQFVHRPPRPLLSELSFLRDEIRVALQAGPPPQRARELLFLGGLAIELLAQITGILGATIAAMRHAVGAESLAERVGHRDLRAWTIGTKALIAEWSGNLPAAIAFAREAMADAPAGHQQIRLATVEARCAARIGQHRAAESAIARAVRAFDSGLAGPDTVAQFGGSLYFRMPKMASYIGTTYRILGDHRNAERWALEAVQAYATGPVHDRSYGHEAISRADIAIIHIERGAVDSAGEVLAPVFDLPACQRVQRVVESMQTVQKSLLTRGDMNGATPGTLGERIDSFVRTDALMVEQPIAC
ncbi:hypothetical protein [Nocardia abscessus]|uniref:hypothetical protein n=1 Tax=Nocardia abscessus TaxID=120957 RepID=UPI0024580A00|nr:hypothetical protein [Nocardia abscessus]